METEPGTNVFAFEKSFIKIVENGRLSAVGTQTDSIIFRNYPKQKWYGLYFEEKGRNNHLKFCSITGASSELTQFGGGFTPIDQCGGAVRLDRSFLVIENSNIYKNFAQSSGGGVFAYNSDLTLLNSVLENNQSILYSGGGLSVEFGNANISHCIFADNKAQRAGGAVYISQEVSAILCNNIFYNNHAGDIGGAMYLFDERAKIQAVNNTIVQNSAQNFGGAIYVKQSMELLLKNNIIWYNTASLYGSLYFSDIEYDLPISISYNNIEMESPESIFGLRLLQKVRI
ncbi:right-handed parallel beta-helix repeat-containing protein [candidate division KSB1 bacterium]|nr:right-handed parallel beta-helix repeat-containing protein [candidate division KSB1 bacterium]